MIKAALFDIDGIVIVGRKQFFSHKLAEKQKISRESVEEFFLGNFKKCSFGRADLKEEIAPFLPKWNWHESVDDLLKFWFESEDTKDEKVLGIVSALREKGVKCYIATRQEKYRLGYLLEEVGLQNYFDGTFCTCNVGYDKKDPEFFHRVFNELKLKPEEILFFDDALSNIENAKTLGINAHLYTNIGILEEQTKDIIR